MQTMRHRFKVVFFVENINRHIYKILPYFVKIKSHIGEA